MACDGCFVLYLEMCPIQYQFSQRPYLLNEGFEAPRVMTAAIFYHESFQLRELISTQIVKQAVFVDALNNSERPQSGKRDVFEY